MRQAKPLLLRIVAGVAVLLAPALASADILWQLTKKRGQPYLQGMPDETESDTQFWAHCRADGAIEVGVGANSNVGKGKGEPVTLQLVSGPARATLSGVSRDSVNVEMTSGTELRAKISRGHEVFQVLATGKPIAVSGAIEPETWPVKGLKAKVAAFLQGCR